MPGRELRYVLRGIRRRPAVTLVVVLTLGLAIGANTTVFSLVDSVLLAPLPFAQPDRLVAIWEIAPEQSGQQWRVSPLNYRRWAEPPQFLSDHAPVNYVAHLERHL